MLQRVLIDEAVEVLFEFTRHLRWATRSWTIHQALRSLPGQALYPCAQSRIRTVKGRGDGVDVVASDDFPDGLRAAKDARLLRLLEHGISGHQCIITKMAFEGAHRFAPGGYQRGIPYVTDSEARLIGAQ